ncbi:MAG: hypothetical protein JWM11_4894, partial [Planctomycetaceae bacterium]|nr:hypothetical protein [Planctomycetaceae bacterium]
EDDPSILWHESTGIDAQGQFEFPSLPRGGELQIIALCDDWLSKSTLEEAEGFFITGQLFPIDAPEISIQVEMEPTGTLEVTLKKPGGLPLAGATVGTSPNQLFYKSGSTVLGEEFNSRTDVLRQLTPREKREWPYPSLNNSPFVRKTDDSGKVIFKGIPIGRNESLSIVHPQYSLPIQDKDPFGNRREIKYQLDSAKPKQLELVAEELVTAPDSDKK